MRREDRFSALLGHPRLTQLHRSLCPDRASVAAGSGARPNEPLDAAITEREGRGETAETRFVSIDGSTVTAAELRGRTAQITIRFVSKLVSATATDPAP